MQKGHHFLQYHRRLEAILKTLWFRYGQVYTFSAWCYYRLGEYTRAADYFHKVGQDWPGYLHGANAQYMVGVCYELLKNSPDTAISQDAVDERIIAAYEAVVERFPEKLFATGACMKLGQLYFAKEQWAEAIVYLEMYFERRPEHYRTLRILGEAYEKIGDKELAIAVYEQYLAIAGQEDYFRDDVQQKLDDLKGGQ